VLSFYEVMENLLDAVSGDLGSSEAGMPDRIGIVPGDIAYDECECGLLAASLNRIYFSDVFPAELQTLVGIGGCDASYIAGDIIIELARCAPSAQEPAIAPTVEALADSARWLLEDANLVRNAVVCALEKLDAGNDIGTYLVRGQVFKGPQGGCVGSSLRVTVGLLQGVL
jgi:hypothetical protein